MPYFVLRVAKLTNYSYFCIVSEVGAGWFLSFFIEDMERNEFQKVIEKAAQERACSIVEVKFDDDDNVFEVIIDKDDADVSLDDCEYIHRAVLDAFDRNIEDYSMTVSSLGIDAGEADEMLKQ